MVLILASAGKLCCKIGLFFFQILVVYIVYPRFNVLGPWICIEVLQMKLNHMSTIKQMSNFINLHLHSVYEIEAFGRLQENGFDKLKDR